MTWLSRYQMKRTLRWSLWLMPVLSIGVALLAAALVRWLDRVTGWSWFNLSPDGARAILGAFTASMLTFVVFVVTSMLIVVQLASAQLTPRIIATTGWTTDELNAAIDAAEPLGHWDLVSLLIGVNNQYRGRTLVDYRSEFRALLSRAIGFANGRAHRVLVVSIPDWGVTPFARTEARDRKHVSDEIDAFNAAAQEIAQAHGVAFVDITPASRANAVQVAEDGLHPDGAAAGALGVAVVLEEQQQGVAAELHEAAAVGVGDAEEGVEAASDDARELFSALAALLGEALGEFREARHVGERERRVDRVDARSSGIGHEVPRYHARHVRNESLIRPPDRHPPGHDPRVRPDGPDD